MSNNNGNGAMTIVEDDESLLGGMVRPEASVSTAIQLAAAMLDKRIATARQFPRSVARFKAEASELLKEDLETARSAEYAKPVGGSTVKGPSVRLMELAAMCWGNLEVEVNEPIIGDKSVFVSASAWDLQRNLRMPGTASTSILKRDGSRYPAHMIETACAATAAKAKRNAILNVIPRAYVSDILNVAKKVAAGTEKTMEQRRQEMVDFFGRNFKVQPEQIFERLSIAGVDDMTEECLADLRAIATSLKDNESKPEEWFASKTESKTAAIKAKLDERKANVKPAAKTEAPPESKPPEPTKPAAPVDDKLAELLKTFDARGGNLAAWMDEQGYDSLQTLLETKNKARSEACSALNAAIQGMAGEGAK